jgi:hypothetical protein
MSKKQLPLPGKKTGDRKVADIPLVLPQWLSILGFDKILKGVIKPLQGPKGEKGDNGTNGTNGQDYQPEKRNWKFL